MMKAPKVDERTGAEVAQEIYARLRLDRLREDKLKGRLDVALVNIFGRFSELVIERLNKAPEKKFLAFLDLMGVSPLPMEAADVPLTFFMTPTAGGPTVVRAGTQIAASPANSNQKPVVFETQADLVVTGIKLDSLFLRNGREAYADLGSALPPDAKPGQEGMAKLPEKRVDAAFRPIPHLLFIPIPTNPTWRSIDRVRVSFRVDNSSVSASGTIQWETGSGDVDLNAEPNPSWTITLPEMDTMQNLTTTGTVEFKSLPVASVVRGSVVASQWLCCRLLTPLVEAMDTVSSDHALSPMVQDVVVETEQARSGLPLEQAFSERLAVDITKDFFPFGQRPRLGDALYLGSREAFSEQGGVITLHIELANPDGPGPDLGLPRAKPNHLELVWEFWDGEAWSALSTSGRSLRLGVEEDSSDDAEPTVQFSDGTQSLSRSGPVTFSFSRLPAELNLNGVKNYWVRVRIAAGDYGREIQVLRDEATGTVSTLPATLAPPSIRSVKIDYSVRRQSKPSVVQLNEWQLAQVTPDVPFRLFNSPGRDQSFRSLYLGFRTIPLQAAAPETNINKPAVGGEQGFPHVAINAYVLLDEQVRRESEEDSDQTAQWEYWTTSGWKRFVVGDGTMKLRRSGLLQFLLPRDFAPSDEFGRRRYWVRMRLNQGETPPIRSILLNTTMAVQGLTVSNESLGSSSGEPSQKFLTTYPSVLPAQKLEVREPTLPSQSDRELLSRNTSADCLIRPVTSKTGKTEYWVTWREVNSFYGSAGRSRHYILDHQTGQILFGDGVSGMIPPILADNILMTHYRTGGGANGNQPALAVKQLLSAVPYIQKVVNLVPATGGSDAEPVGAIIERGPREIRHGGRAVTSEDFEDLALRSSREVARVHCVPRCDLAKDPDAKHLRPGLVSVIVVPRSTDSKPAPCAGLLDQVKQYLDARRVATAHLVVGGPDYVRIDVEAEIVVDRAEDESRVEQKVEAELAAFLHPIRGGPGRSGWDFGRLPARSDLYVLIERVAGVSHVRSLNLNAVPERPGAEKTKHFLIYGGRSTFTMTL